MQKHICRRAREQSGKPRTRAQPFLKLAVCIFCSAFNKLLTKEDFQGFLNMVSAPAYVNVVSERSRKAHVFKLENLH